MYAVVCACGRRAESSFALDFGWLRTSGHDPDRCSAEVAYHGRIRGRQEMVDVFVAHLAERRTLSGEEIAEIRTNMANAASTLPLS